MDRLTFLRNDREREQKQADAYSRAGYKGAAEDRGRRIARIDREIAEEGNAPSED